MTEFQAAMVREYVSEITLALEENGGVVDVNVIEAERDFYRYLDSLTIA